MADSLPWSQPSLYTAPLTAWTFSSHWSWREGWSLVCAARREGQAWDDELARWYSNLTTAETFEVAGYELQRLGDL